MDFEAILNLLSNAAFPIVAFILLFWLVKDELHEIRNVVQQNTQVISTLIEHFHKEGDDK